MKAEIILIGSSLHGLSSIPITYQNPSVTEVDIINLPKLLILMNPKNKNQNFKKRSVVYKIIFKDNTDTETLKTIRTALIDEQHIIGYGLKYRTSQDEENDNNQQYRGVVSYELIVTDADSYIDRQKENKRLQDLNKAKMIELRKSYETKIKEIISQKKEQRKRFMNIIKKQYAELDSVYSNQIDLMVEGKKHTIDTFLSMIKKDFKKLFGKEYEDIFKAKDLEERGSLDSEYIDKMFDGQDEESEEEEEEDEEEDEEEV